MSKTDFTIKGAAGRVIIGDITSPAGVENPPLVIFAHGFKGFKDWGTHNLTASLFAGEGLRYLKFNFSHSGISVAGRDSFDDLNAFSQNTFSKELFDLDQVITYAMSGKEFPAPEQLFLIGHSLGGGISVIQTAEDKRISKLATWAAVSSFRSLWSNEQEAAWRENGIMYVENKRTNQQMPLDIALLDDLNHHSERLDVLNAARRIDRPWLIVHGEADTSVAVGQAHELNRQHEGSEILLIPGGDHVFGAKHPWTDEMLPEQLKTVAMATINFFRQ